MTSLQRITDLEQLITKLDAQLTQLRNAQRSMQTEIDVHKNNANHWRKRYEMVQHRAPSAADLVFDLSPELIAALHREAIVRILKPVTLAKRIVATVVRDNLFVAVLDQ